MAAFLGLAVWVWSGCGSTKPGVPRPKALQEAERLAHQAATLQANRDWNGALVWWDRAARQYGLLHDRAQVAVAHHNLGMVRRALGRLEEASTDLEKASRLNAELGQRDSWWRNQLGLLQVGNDAQAPGVVALLKRLEAEPDCPTEGRLAAVLAQERARAGLTAGGWAEALTEAERAGRLYALAGDTAGVAATGVLRGRILRRLGKNEEAIGLWQEALKVFEQIGDVRGIAVCLAGWGGSVAALGKDLRLAEELLRDAEENYRALGILAEADAIGRERAGLGRGGDSQESR